MTATDRDDLELVLDEAGSRYCGSGYGSSDGYGY